VRNTILRTAPVEVRLSKAAFSGGNGTETDPYLIAKAEDLQALASYVNGEQSAAYRQKHYCQTADIDLHAQGYFTPIGHTADHAFTGQYDGGFHTITGLGIRNTGTKPSALFGHCGSGSVLRGIRLQDVKIQTTSGYAAAVVAYDDAGEVRDCSAQGSIRSTGNIDNLSYTGGIAGRASRAQFTDCSFQGSIVASSNHAGGIIGEAENGCTIRDCRFLAGSSLQCNYYGGGITGAAGGADTEISGCVCEGDVSTSGWNAGGIAGVLYQGIISDCVQSNVSTVFSNQYNAGGIAGSLHTNSTGKNFAAQVAGCAVYGDICGQHQVGGIAGSCQVGNAGESATIARCGIRGATITAQGRDADGFSSAGGICGLLKGNGHSSIRHCFARPGSIRLTDKYAQGAAGGIAGRIMQGDAVLENCYSTLSPSSLLSSGQAAETGTGIAGSCPVAATLTDCHYLQDYRPAPADGKQHITDCYGFSRSDMTGGKLLETLNAHAPGIWETDAEGYPSVCQLPADTRESAAPKKRVSIIGDSISTFSGYLATGKYNGKSCTTHYPNASNAACDVLSVDQTWWHQLIYQYMQNARFERNISSGNTTVVQNTTATASASQYWYNWDFCTRFIAFGGVGAPDIVFIHGGTNDLGHISSYGASEKLIGAQAMNSPDAPDAAALEALFATADACSSLAQAEALDYSTFCAAYIKLIRMIQLRHPGAKIVCLIGDCVSAGMQAGIQSIAGHYGAKYVDFLAINGFRGKYPLTKYDGVTHPDANGMTFMAKTIYQQLGEWLEN
ncbi:MAG: hypothetical protein J5871_04145, partial [Bacteroidales bacterium]|nr:hypothetical protein [Bacteroidales bacterium]